ncbi:MAG TPA: tRNA uridine-5-carboxymethylaminomethyl(34) synthesis GTPase MnmE [Ruminococcaceae bacterium]|nr:tRNA uridine-5-carboxymethylaminomethyl(34) synthesis GTPase MnmE [Oscillospiraceae bacterium]
MNQTSTIAAVSTPVAAGGIGVIRISGPDAVRIAQTVFRPSSGKSVSEMKGYTAAFGKVYDGDTPIDEAVLLIFRAPHSYTGEDVAEISCHGGIYLVNRALRAAIRAGASPAAPGEFTKRAFLNGKLDLTEAEAVMNLISAQGEQGAAAALTALEGALSRKLREAAQILITDSAYMAAWVDYPDDEIEELSQERLLSDYRQVADSLEALLKNYEGGRALTQGVDTVIAGKPNVGKSTLMNCLSGFDRSIVTAAAGTTRDVVEDTIRLGEMVLRLADTAGIRATDNEAEKIGVEFALGRIERAELVLAVFDGSQPLSEEDRQVIARCKNKKAIALINKSDLPQQLDTADLRDFFRMIPICAKNSDGIQALSQAVLTVLGSDSVDTSAAMLANERQRAGCEQALLCVKEAMDALKGGMTLDAVNVSTDSAVDALLSLTGERAGEAVVNEIFSRFCVGK